MANLSQFEAEYGEAHDPKDDPERQAKCAEDQRKFLSRFSASYDSTNAGCRATNKKGEIGVPHKPGGE